jgi:hypothetical protein
MHHSTTRLVARVCTALIALVLVVGPASAKPKADHGSKGHKQAATKQQHGKAVRVAAKCPVEGKAHGQLVKSIARNKSATVADATAACEEALALQEEEEELDDELDEGDELEDELDEELADEPEDGEEA